MGDVPGLETSAAVADALARIRNILAELAALYHVLSRAKPGALTIVHDYKGIAEWMEGRRKRRDPTVEAVIATCQRLLKPRGVRVTFHHQRGHQKFVAGRDEFAYFNTRADELAAGGAKKRP